MILSAYSVETSTTGFDVCEWPATGLADAERWAQHMSERFASDPRYPNPFWVIDPIKGAIGKWWRGQRYAATQSI